MNFNYISSKRATLARALVCGWLLALQPNEWPKVVVSLQPIPFTILFFAFLVRFRLLGVTMMTISNSFRNVEAELCVCSIAHLFDWHLNSSHMCALPSQDLLLFSCMFFFFFFQFGTTWHQPHVSYSSSHVPIAHHAQRVSPRKHTHYTQVLVSRQIKNRIVSIFPSAYIYLSAVFSAVLASVSQFGQIGNFVLIFHLHARPLAIQKQTVALN